MSLGAPQAEPLLPEAVSRELGEGGGDLDELAKIFLQMSELGHVHNSNKIPLREGSGGSVGDGWSGRALVKSAIALRQAGVLQGARGAWGPRFCKAAIKRGRPECFWARPCLTGVSQGGAGERSPEFGGAGSVCTAAVFLARGHMLLEAGRWGTKCLGPRNLLGDKMSQ